MTVALASGDQHGVVADRVGVDVHHLVLDDQPGRKLLPGLGIEADAGDRADVPGQSAAQGGEFVGDAS